MPRISLLIILILLFLPAPVAALDPQAARQELERLNIPLTNDEFLKRVEAGDSRVVDLLLDAGMDPNLTNGEDYPVLVTAANKGHADIVKELLAHGADPNLKSAGEYGITPLAFAALVHDFVNTMTYSTAPFPPAQRTCNPCGGITCYLCRAT
jgi:ankyrin repeat protein